MDVHFEPPRTQQRGVKRLGPVSSTNNNDAFCALDPIELREKRREDSS